MPPETAGGSNPQRDALNNFERLEVDPSDLPPGDLADAAGMSTFALEDGVVYHAYSAYARGMDGLGGMYQWLDQAPKGRNEDGLWFRRHDEYDSELVRVRVFFRVVLTGERVFG